MNIIIVSISMIFFISIFVPIIIISLNIAKEMKRNNDIKEKEVKNEINKLYLDIDIVKCKEIIDDILNQYINKWVLINITSRGDDYIKDQEIAELIKYTTSQFILEMSDVHLFYIKCLTNISDDDSLIRFVRNEVKFLVLDFVTEFNKIV